MPIYELHIYTKDEIEYYNTKEDAEEEKEYYERVLQKLCTIHEIKGEDDEI